MLAHGLAGLVCTYIPCNWPGGMVRHRTPISSRTGCAVIVERFMSLMEFHMFDIVEKTLVTVCHSGVVPV